MAWHIYIVECKDTKFYTGITNNLKRRVRDHNSGNGCRFTKYRFPVKLLYSEEVVTRSQALKREAHIKNLPKQKKIELVTTFRSTLELNRRTQ